jgi:hypothetical protein
MKKNLNNQSDMSNDLISPSSKALKGRQSVRATFRLSEACIEAISILSAHLGIKQKSVFDHLLEDQQALKIMASELDNGDDNQDKRVQKTFVISRRSLSYLDSASKKFDTSRDDLVEYSIRRLFPIVASEQIKHEKRKKLLTEIADHMAAGTRLLTKAEKTVGKNDLVASKLKSVLTTYQSAMEDIEKFVKKGKPIERFESE